MADIVSRETRSRMMSGIRGKNTKPERQVRSELHRRGFRFRLHQSKLPGKPDLVLPKYKAVIFVHGCFWHGHNCHLFKWPKTRPNFWRQKIERNRAVDERAKMELERSQWRILVIWECALKGKSRLGAEAVAEQAAEWLRAQSARGEISGRDQ